MPFGCRTTVLSAGGTDGLVLGEVAGDDTDVESDGDGAGELAVVTEGEEVVAGGGVVPQAVNSSTAPKPPRARNEKAMHQR